MAVVSSRNLFIDSSTNISGEGDNFVLEMSGHTISAGDGQILRLTLVNFNMYNNTYEVNDSNNLVQGSIVVNSNITDFDFRLAVRNYPNLNTLSREFQQKFRDEIVSQRRVLSGNNGLTAAISGIKNGVDPGPIDGDRIISFKLIFGTHATRRIRYIIKQHARGVVQVRVCEKALTVRCSVISSRARARDARMCDSL